MSTQETVLLYQKFTDYLRAPQQTPITPPKNPPKKPKKVNRNPVQIVTIDRWRSQTVVTIHRGTYSQNVGKYYDKPTQRSLQRLGKVLNHRQWRSHITPNVWGMSVFYFAPVEEIGNV